MLEKDIFEQKQHAFVLTYNIKKVNIESRANREETLGRKATSLS